MTPQSYKMGWVVVENNGRDRVERLVHEYGERAFRLAYRLAGNIEEAKDLVQESYRRALAHWDQYDPDLPLEKWFFSILRHLFLDVERRYERKHVVSLEAPVVGNGEEAASYADVLPDQEEEILTVLEREESVESVRRAFEGLSYEHRIILAMCDMEGMRYEEAAGILNCPIATIRSRICRARRALKRNLLRNGGVRAWVV